MADEAFTETELEAQPSDVWEAITSPDGIEQWMGEGSTITDDGDLWLRDFVTGTPRVGHVEEVDPERQLDLVWWPEDDPTDRSKVSIRLEPLTVGTRVVVIESPIGIGATASAAAGTAAHQWRLAVLGVVVRGRCLLRAG